MLNLQVVISLVAVILTLAGYFSYISNTIKGNTKPHLFTWLVFTVSGFTAYGLQVLGGGGVGTWSLLVACILCLLIFLLSLRLGIKDISSSDVVFMLLSAVALFLWLVVKQPILAAVLVTSVEILGFLPTVRKSWNNPHSENLFTYQTFAARFGLSIFALQNLNTLTTLYPATWLLANLLFIVILMARRKVVGQPERG